MDKQLRKVLCITHRKDVDGLASGAIIKHATQADIILSDYEKLLEDVRNAADFHVLYLCDMGLSREVVEELLRKSSTSTIHFIDHHPLDEGSKERLVKGGVKVIHSQDEASSILCYQVFRDKLPLKAELLAAYGAVTDYMDTQPTARSIIQGYDRQFILLEASMLSYAIARRSGDTAFLLEVVNALSRLMYPHQINGVSKLAVEQAERMVELIREAEVHGRRLRNLAYMETDEHSTGNLAHFLIGVFDKPVGVAYKIHQEEGESELSLRASDKCGVNLGRIVFEAADRVSGKGGGHPKAAGARIPSNKLEEFLQYIDDRLKVAKA